MVPALTDSIKVAGLVLILDSSEDSDQVGSSASGCSIPEGSNGTLRRNGILTFREMIDI